MPSAPVVEAHHMTKKAAHAEFVAQVEALPDDLIPLWWPRSQSAANSSLKQSVDSRDEARQGSDSQRSVMATPCLRSACLFVDQEYVDQSLDEVAHD
jgi:hypothetical protein